MPYSTNDTKNWLSAAGFGVMLGLILAILIALTVDIYVNAPKKPEPKDKPRIDMILDPLVPAPKEKKPPKGTFETVLSSGELVAFWNAWEKCNGPTCID